MKYILNVQFLKKSFGKHLFLNAILIHLSSLLFTSYPLVFSIILLSIVEDYLLFFSQERLSYYLIYLYLT